MVKKLHLYLIREFCGSFLFGLVVFSMLLLLDQVFQLVDLFLSKGVAFFLVVKLFIYILPNILSLAIPMAVLFGILIAYGRLSEDNEITAMKANGMDYKTLSVPIIVFICIISIFLLFFNHFWSPSMHTNFRSLYEEIITKRPLVTFTEKTITKLGDYQIYANKVNSEDNTLSGVNIYKFEKREKKKTPPAGAQENNIKENGKAKKNKNAKETAQQESAVIVSSSTAAEPAAPAAAETPAENKSALQQDQGTWRIAASSASVKVYFTGAQMTLYNGYWQRANPSEINNMIHMTFKTYTFFIPLGDNLKGQTSSLREMKSPEIRETIKRYKSQELPYVAYENEYWLRWILAIAPIAFVLIAIPIGIMAGKGGKAIGFGMSLGVIFLYYMLLVLAINAGEKGYAPPSLIMWLPNAAVSGIGVYLFTKMVKK